MDQNATKLSSPRSLNWPFANRMHQFQFYVLAVRFQDEGLVQKKGQHSLREFTSSACLTMRHKAAQMNS